MQKLEGFSSGDGGPVRDSAAAEYERDSGPACMLKAIVFRQFFYWQLFYRQYFTG
jgi:hypothetical protein